MLQQDKGFDVMDVRLHDLIHILSELQKLLDKAGKLLEEMVKDDTK